MKNRYRIAIWELVGADHIAHFFFYDTSDILSMGFTELSEEYEKPQLIADVEEEGLARCSEYALADTWKNSI